MFNWHIIVIIDFAVISSGIKFFEPIGLYIWTGHITCNLPKRFPVVNIQPKPGSPCQCECDTNVDVTNSPTNSSQQLHCVKLLKNNHVTSLLAFAFARRLRCLTLQQSMGHRHIQSWKKGHNKASFSLTCSNFLVFFLLSPRIHRLVILCINMLGFGFFFFKGRQMLWWPLANSPSKFWC